MFIAAHLGAAFAAIIASGHASPPPAGHDIQFLGQAQIAGDSKDLSGLHGMATTDTPKDRLGSMGSGIAYTGRSNTYIMVDDRGPSDGDADFPCRAHVVRIDPPAAPGSAGQVTLTGTILLTRSDGAEFNGGSAHFSPDDPSKDSRLDPEAIRIGRDGLMYISDEYGPFIDAFSPEGHLVRAITVPSKFAVAHRDRSAEKELPPNNTAGRQSNRGLEGLAITPAGDRLFAAMQSPLIQDHGLDSANKRIGTNVRILEISLADGKTRELLYPLDSAAMGLNEILAINDHEFLVIERDGKNAGQAKEKRIMKISTAGATDISTVESLPATGVPAGVTPVTKSLFIDLLDAKFGLVGAAFPEKFEGLAFGPDLPDGRHLLIVTTDNDMKAEEPTRFYFFAIAATDLPGFVPQTFAAP
jgi:hypothetical protein